jgi:hypothetical protein
VAGSRRATTDATCSERSYSAELYDVFLIEMWALQKKNRVSALFRTLIGLDSRRTPRRGGHIPFRIIEPSP